MGKTAQALREQCKEDRKRVKKRCDSDQDEAVAKQTHSTKDSSVQHEAAGDSNDAVAKASPKQSPKQSPKFAPKRRAKCKHKKHDDLSGSDHEAAQETVVPGGPSDEMTKPRGASPHAPKRKPRGKHKKHEVSASDREDGDA